MVLLVTTVAIFGFNRVIAQYLLGADLQQRAQTELSSDVLRCEPAQGGLAAFQACLHQSDTASVIEPASIYYKVCGLATSGAQEGVEDATCSAVRAVLSAQALASNAQAGAIPVDSGEWMTAQTSVTSAVAFPPRLVMLKTADVQRYATAIWDLRDSLLTTLFPMLIVVLVFASWVMFRFAMHPVNQLKRTIEQFGADNLSNNTLVAPASLVEFQSFVDVFNSLRQRLSTSLSQSQRFAADASHELKTPLTILRGRGEILVATLVRGSDQQVMALELVEEVERMSEIVEKLLLLSRADAKSLLLDTQTHNFSALMDDFLEDAAGFAPDLDLKTDIAPNIVWACDVALVRLLVQNLYTNAVKYNIPSGWIYFKLHSTPSHVVLRIENAATGIPQDLERNAFSRFYRLDDARSSSRSGHGLGLSICREIADVHNAKIDMTVLDDRVVMTLTFELVPAITI